MKGMELGVELGFYRGVAIGLLNSTGATTTTVEEGRDERNIGIATPMPSILSNLTAAKREKVLASSASIIEIVDNFPFQNMATANNDDDDGEAAASDGGGADDDAVESTSSDVVPDTVQDLQRCRSKFKVLTMMLKLPGFTLKNVLDNNVGSDQPKKVVASSEW
jgi:hypothetical protein